jgi:serine/threonine protein kinase
MKDGMTDTNLPERLGIWRLGTPVHTNEAFCVLRAQPVDAAGSPRWDYAVKLAMDWVGGEGIARSFAAGAMINHPNVVPILDGRATDPIPYLVMPLLEGRTMKWHLSQGPRKPLPVALWLVRQLCQALQAMHASGWTHGDIKPDNLIVGINGHVTLIDLAFSHQGTRVSSSPFRGTPDYAAPELLVNASSSGPASDLFAAGRILWEWLTHVETSNDIVLRPVSALVERMVDEVPQNRPSAGEITKALLRLEIDTLGDHIVPAQQRRAA